jgi:hypothetical protein
MSRVIADTTLDNIASQRTLIGAGFRLVSTDAEFHRYEGAPQWGTRYVAGDVGHRAPCPVSGAVSTGRRNGLGERLRG